MVKALIDISDDANRILNIIKAQYGLKDKSDAIDRMAEDYKELVFEPTVKTSYLKKLEKIRKEGAIKVGTTQNFRNRYNIK